MCGMLYVSLLDGNGSSFSLLSFIYYFFIHFLAASRDWLSAGGIKGEASRDGKFGHSPTAKGARESRGRQPSKNAH